MCMSPFPSDMKPYNIWAGDLVAGTGYGGAAVASRTNILLTSIWMLRSVHKRQSFFTFLQMQIIYRYYICCCRETYLQLNIGR